MKLIRIFGLASHSFKERTSGVDFVRIIQPLKALNGYKDDEVEFKTTIFDPKNTDSFDWRDVFRDYDIVYFNYVNNDIGYAIMGLMAQKYGRKLVCDLDDNLWSILPDNGAYEAFKKGSEGIKIVTAIFNDVHYMTCTNHYLRNAIAFNTLKTHDKIKIFPNYIDLDLYKHRCNFKDRGYYVGLHFGSSTHFTSLANEEFKKGMDRIMRDYPNFTLHTVGAFLPSYQQKWGARYKQGFGAEDIFKWIEIMPKFLDEADFMIVPLNDNVYNRSKSAIKRWEASSAKLPFIAQNIRQYNEVIDNGIDGFLCNTADDWYNSISKLILDKDLRRSMGEAGYQRTVREAQIQDHVVDYANFFKSIIE